VWNRLRFIKDPDTGKWVPRPTPKDQWIVEQVPELAIVEPAIWDRLWV
jgi:hypothetical protein